MPGFDRSGPMRAGPMTGGRRGFCGRTTDGSAFGGGYPYGRALGFRRGYGGGRGRGCGPAWGGFAYPPAYAAGYALSQTDEMEMLRADADALRRTLDTIQNKIAQLEKQGSE